MGDGAGNDKPNNEGNNNNELDQPENEKVEDEQELENSEGQDPEGSGGGDGEGEEDNSGTGDGSGGDHSGEPEIVLPDPDGGGRFIWGPAIRGAGQMTLHASCEASVQHSRQSWPAPLFEAKHKKPRFFAILLQTWEACESMAGWAMRIATSPSNVVPSLYNVQEAALA
jgi:hypothetical protein